jgi:parallel beta-helix repeat protein
VFNNKAYENTGGILVFDLPDLVLKKGGNCKIYKNDVRNNNYPNFAPTGNVVGKVPDGTGVLILAANNVEIFDNQIINNRTVGAGIISYFMTETPINDKEYYPYPNNINIHNNNFERENVRATSKRRMGKLYRFKLKFGKDVPHIQWDGIEDKNQPFKLCLKDNKNQSFVSFDAENGFKNMSRDMSKFACE